MTAETLKNCPFCGGKADMSLDDGGYYCKDCGCMPYVETTEEPADVWNRRTEPIDYDKLRDHLQLVVNLLERGDKTVASEACIRALAWVFNIISNGNKDFDFDPIRIGDEFGLICDKSSRVGEPIGNSDELPLWMREVIEMRKQHLIPHLINPYVKNTFERGFHSALNWVLSLKKPEKE